MEYPVDQEVKKDTRWWKQFMPLYNGTYIMWMVQELEGDALMATDSCLEGVGGCSRGRYFYAAIPKELQENKNCSIVHFELIALVIGVWLWAKDLEGHRFMVNCDNEAVVKVINKGATRDSILLQ